jgi:undecaprenyl-phosphate galactose phosphotransferase
VSALFLAFVTTTVFGNGLILYTHYAWIMVIILSISFFKKIYTSRFDFWGDMKAVFQTYAISTLIVLSVLTLADVSHNYDLLTLFSFFIFGIIFTIIVKRLLKHFLFSFTIFKIKVKLIAAEAHRKTIEQEIRKNLYLGYALCDKEYDMLLISSKAFDVISLQDILKKFLQQTKDIYIIPYVDHIDFSHTTIIDFSNIRLSAIHLENRLLNRENILIKNIFEKTLVLFIFPFALLLHLILWLSIRLDSPGTVLFKQKRLGKNGREFSCYKYRTMYVKNNIILKTYLQKHPEENDFYKKYHKYKNDPRITRIGNFLRKTSLDEFPQFYNILRGDMNLIGPRPYMLDEREAIGESNLEIILASKPGLTGLWQVSGRSDLTFEERIQLDIWYIQNWSLWIDFVIFIKTIKVVLFKIGAK